MQPFKKPIRIFGSNRNEQPAGGLRIIAEVLFFTGYLGRNGDAVSYQVTIQRRHAGGCTLPDEFQRLGVVRHALISIQSICGRATSAGHSPKPVMSVVQAVSTEHDFARRLAELGMSPDPHRWRQLLERTHR
jgi:hypothetical protein